jgi:hypothetical protein
MMAKGLVLREVPRTSPLLRGDKPPAARGQAPCCAGTSPLLRGDKPPAARGRAPRGNDELTWVNIRASLVPRR